MKLGSSEQSSDSNPSPGDGGAAKQSNISSKPSWPLWGRLIAFSIAYFLCAQASAFLSVPNTTYVSFWLPAGLYVAVLLLNETRHWPLLILAALPANLLFDALRGTRLVEVLPFFLANTVQSVTGAWLVRRFVAVKPTLATHKEFLGLLGCSAAFSTTLGATIGAATLVAVGSSPSFVGAWKVWWGSCAMAIAVLSPFILTWFSVSDVHQRELFRSPGKKLEAVLLLVVQSTGVWYLLFVGQGVMSPNKGPLWLPLLWAGLRFGPRGATAASLLLALPVAFLTTQYSKGLTSAQVASGDFVFVMQVSLLIASLAGQVVAIVLRERDRETARLRESKERLKHLTAAAFEGLCISENGRIVDLNEQALEMFGCERGEILGREIVEFVSPESREVVSEAVRKGQETLTAC